MVEGQAYPERSTRESSVILNDDITVDMNEGDIGHGDDSASVGGKTLNKVMDVRDEKVVENIKIVDSDLDSSSSDLESAEKTADQDERQHRDPNEVDWDGPDDPECPMNWPRWRKSWIIIILSVLRLLMWAVSSPYDDLLSPFRTFVGKPETDLNAFYIVHLLHR